MVNYVRMEEVWRSYGPLEPIGASEGKPRRGRRVALVGGVVAVCALGAAAGLWLKPDLTDSAREPRPERAAGAAVTAPGPDQDELAEAAALQNELLIAVAGEGAPAPVSNAPLESSAAPAPDIIPSAPAPAPRAAAAPPPTPSRAAPPPFRPAVADIPRRPLSRVGEPAPQVVNAPPPRISPTPRPGPTLRPLPPGPATEPIAPPPPIATAPPPTLTPSFDCSRARTTAERMVCDDPHLAALDRQVSAELVGAMAAGHNPRELLRDQRNWSRRRDRAAPDPRALADSYQQRISQLRSMQ